MIESRHMLCSEEHGLHGVRAAAIVVSPTHGFLYMQSRQKLINVLLTVNIKHAPSNTVGIVVLWLNHTPFTAVQDVRSTATTAD